MLKFKPGQESNTPYYYPPQQVAQNFSPGIAATQGSGLLVAGATGPPVIPAGAVAPHTDRGVCTNCHMVVSSRQNPIPAISANSTMPHEFRGVCSNCHRLAIQGGPNTNPYRTQAATPVAAVRQVVTPGTMAPARTATEGEWMGLEVTPITPLTARQYGVFDGTPGLVVAEAEGQAATVGIRAGDVVVSVNGVPITYMADFFQATRNGTLTQGVVEVVRQGQRLSVNIAQATNPASATLPNTPLNLPPAGMRAAMPTPQGNVSIAPAYPAEWGGGQGLDGAGGRSAGAGWPSRF
jgi:hypothetical protein